MLRSGFRVLNFVLVISYRTHWPEGKQSRYRSNTDGTGKTVDAKVISYFRHVEY